MGEQPATPFSEALHDAIKAKGWTQATLAARLGIDPGQVSRWANAKRRPHVETVKQLEQLLGTNLIAAFSQSKPEFELYVSAPITSLEPARMAEHRDKVATVVEAARLHVNGAFWPGEDIRGHDDLLASNLATERNFAILHRADAVLFLHFDQIVGPSSALVELGFALGRRLKTTIIYQRDLEIPFMLEGFDGVAASSSHLPRARTYPVASAAAAAQLIRRNGRGLLGLA